MQAIIIGSLVLLAIVTRYSLGWPVMWPWFQVACALGCIFLGIRRLRKDSK